MFLQFDILTGGTVRPPWIVLQSVYFGESLVCGHILQFSCLTWAQIARRYAPPKHRALFAICGLHTHNIEMYLREMRWCFIDWINLAQDKAAGRVL